LINDKAQIKFRNKYPSIPIYTLFYDTEVDDKIFDTSIEKAAFIIGIKKDMYHAVSAFKYKNKLFCFDSHGKLSKNIIANEIFPILGANLGIKPVDIYIYKGTPIHETEMVCVGLSINFLSKMANHFLKLNSIPPKNKYNNAVYNSMIKKNKNIFQRNDLIKQLTTNKNPTKINNTTPSRKRKSRNKSDPMSINTTKTGSPMVINTTPKKQNPKPTSTRRKLNLF